MIPLLALILCPLEAQDLEVDSEQELFSTLAIKVLKYVEWEGQDKVELGQRIRVGVYDRTMGKGYLSAFTELCDKFPEAFKLSDLTQSENEGEEFDLVFVAGRGRLPVDLLSSFEAKPVLIVGEHAKILENGGVIRFQVSNDKRAEYGINLKQARSSGLKIKSSLLRGAVELIR